MGGLLPQAQIQVLSHLLPGTMCHALVDLGSNFMSHHALRCSFEAVLLFGSIPSLTPRTLVKSNAILIVGFAQ